jgi:hypothetical protein
VFICEMLDTALMDELQAVVVNRLRGRGVLTENTRMVTHRYDTFAELGAADLSYYGYRIMMPKHRWPHYADERAGWLPVQFQPRTERAVLSSIDLNRCIGTRVKTSLCLTAEHDGEINAIRISGSAHLTNTLCLEATNAFNWLLVRSASSA